MEFSLVISLILAGKGTNREDGTCYFWKPEKTSVNSQHDAVIRFSQAKGLKVPASHFYMSLLYHFPKYERRTLVLLKIRPDSL